MSPRFGKVHRLVRLNEFRQEQAGSVLRDAIAAQVEADRHHQDTLGELDRVDAMRPQVLVGNGVDLVRYEILLAMERRALAEAEAARMRCVEREQATSSAKDGLLTAATATRVSRQRSGREQAAIAVADEKRQFDRVADLRGNLVERKP